MSGGSYSSSSTSQPRRVGQISTALQGLAAVSLVRQWSRFGFPGCANQAFERYDDLTCSHTRQWCLHYQSRYRRAGLGAEVCRLCLAPAYCIFAADNDADKSRVFPNSIARSRAEKKVFVGDEIEDCRVPSGLAYRRPFEKVLHAS